jgi:hypothetical protein
MSFQTFQKNLVIRNENGVALMQAMVISGALLFLIYALTQATVNFDKSSMRMIRRNDNLNLSLLISDEMNTAPAVKRATLVLEQDEFGNAVLYP